MDILRRLKYVKGWFWAILAATLAGLLLLTLAHPNYYRAVNTESMEANPQITANTARIPGQDPIATAISVSQNIYPGTFKDNKPNGVLLVPVDDWRAALLAAEIIHFPINSPILYTERTKLNEETLKEIKRLDPEGIFQDRNLKVLIIGSVEPAVTKALEEEQLLYRVLNADSAFELASLLDDYKAMFHLDHDDQVLIVPHDEPAYAVLAVSWVAHAGHSIFFVGKDADLPESLRHSLANRPQEAYMYVLADSNTIPGSVLQELSRYGHVQRVPGNDPYEMSTGFAGYKDVGANFAWWIEREPRNFGWGISEAGHNFTFINPENPQICIPAAILSHKGKHGPFLMVKQNEVPVSVQKYLQLVQPTFLSNQQPLYNHGWIIGDAEVISAGTQEEIDKYLSVKR